MSGVKALGLFLVLIIVSFWGSYALYCAFTLWRPINPFYFQCGVSGFLWLLFFLLAYRFVSLFKRQRRLYLWSVSALGLHTLSVAALVYFESQPGAVVAAFQVLVIHFLHHLLLLLFYPGFQSKRKPLYVGLALLPFVLVYFLPSSAQKAAIIAFLRLAEKDAIYLESKIEKSNFHFLDRFRWSVSIGGAPLLLLSVGKTEAALILDSYLNGYLPFASELPLRLRDNLLKQNNFRELIKKVAFRAQAVYKNTDEEFSLCQASQKIDISILSGVKKYETWRFFFASTYLPDIAKTRVSFLARVPIFRDRELTPGLAAQPNVSFLDTQFYFPTYLFWKSLKTYNLGYAYYLHIAENSQFAKAQYDKISLEKWSAAAQAHHLKGGGILVRLPAASKAPSPTKRSSHRKTERYPKN